MHTVLSLLTVLFWGKAVVWPGLSYVHRNYGQKKKRSSAKYRMFVLLLRRHSADEAARHSYQSLLWASSTTVFRDCTTLIVQSVQHPTSIKNHNHTAYWQIFTNVLCFAFTDWGWIWIYLCRTGYKTEGRCWVQIDRTKTMGTILKFE